MLRVTLLPGALFSRGTRAAALGPLLPHHRGINMRRLPVLSVPTGTGRPLPGLHGGRVAALPARSRKQQRGLSLLDLQLVLALSAACLAAAVGSTFFMVQTDTSVAQARSWILQTVTRAQASYASRADFSLLTQSSAIHDGLFPAAAMANGLPINPWGGDFAMSGCGCAGAPKEIVITMDGVPAGACVQLISSMRTTDGRAKVNNYALNPGGKPTDTQELIQKCSNVGQAGGHIQFFFDKRMS